MRIISGKFKARRLVSFNAEHIRPTTDRVKESIFNILANKVEDARVLDLYSGTGSLGLEAISRGAKYVEMVEQNSHSIQIIVKNIKVLDLKEDVKIRKMDVIRYLTSYKGKPFDIVLIDPPFPSKICHGTLETLSASQALSKETSVVIEHSKHESLEEKVGVLRRVDRRDYGDKLVSFFRMEDNVDGA